MHEFSKKIKGSCFKPVQDFKKTSRCDMALKGWPQEVQHQGVLLMGVTTGNANISCVAN